MDEALSRYCCQNPGCPDHGQRGLGNLTACARYGEHQHIRLLYGRTCRDRFCERKGTPCRQSTAREVWENGTFSKGWRVHEAMT